MPKYRIHFCDGSRVDKQADTGTIAKAAAKVERVKETGATTKNDPRVKVARVEELGAGGGAGKAKKSDEDDE